MVRNDKDSGARLATKRTLASRGIADTGQTQAVARGAKATGR